MCLRTAWSLEQGAVSLKQYNHLLLNVKPLLSRITKIVVLEFWEDMMHFEIGFLFRTFLLQFALISAKHMGEYC